MNLHDYYQKLAEDDLSLVYFGSFNDSITDKIIELSESFLSHKHLKKLKRKAVFLVAECFQNVTKHSDSTSRKGKLEFINSFILRVKGEICYIASVNTILMEKVEYLKNRLNTLNQMESDEILDLYKTVLEEGKFNPKGGASLGLIEMARRTGNKIDFHFEPIGEKFSIFYMMLRFSSERNEIVDEDQKTFLEIRNIYKDLLLSRNYLLFKSDFRHETILPVIQLIESNLNFGIDPFNTKRNLFHGTVEVLQNFNKIGYKSTSGIQGIFSFGKDYADYILQSLFETDNDTKRKLQKLLRDLKDNSTTELRNKYRQAIQSDENLIDLPFIDLARISKNWDYHFIPSDTDNPIFNYRVII